jgi:hypothetical protein
MFALKILKLTGSVYHLFPFDHFDDIIEDIKNQSSIHVFKTLAAKKTNIFNISATSLGAKD